MSGLPEAEGIDPKKMLCLDPFTHFLCRRHAEPFRGQWPRGVAAIMIMALDFIKESHELALEWGELGPDPKNMEVVLAKKQVCERVPPARLLQMYVESGVGVTARCVSCHDLSLGTPYHTSRAKPSWKRPRKKDVIVYPHVCFHCVVYRAYTQESLQ